MRKLAIAPLVLGAVFLFVDHLHPLLAHDIYCRIGAGELRQTRPPAWGTVLSSTLEQGEGAANISRMTRRSILSLKRESGALARRAWEIGEPERPSSMK